jgi:hypothetical protein
VAHFCSMETEVLLEDLARGARCAETSTDVQLATAPARVIPIKQISR